jgi:CHAT domain-containing protein/tetratricopeptide (TPR) repeat protein
MIFGLTILCSLDLIKSQQPDEYKLSIDRISNEISSRYAARDTTGLLSLAESLNEQAGNNLSDSMLKADLYYFSGVCYLLRNNFSKALPNLVKSNQIKKNLSIIDERFLKGIYNIGVAYNSFGDFSQAVDFFTDFITEGNKFYGENNREVISSYAGLLGSLIKNKDYDRLKSYTFDVLEKLRTNSSLLTFRDLSDLYQNIGVAYSHIGDYAKEKVYLELALEYSNKANLPVDHNYINLINNLAATYGYLGMTEKETEFFEKGISLAVSNNSYLAFNFINSYAIELGNSGRADKGEKLLSDLVRKTKSIYGTGSRYYITTLIDFAEYIRDYKNDADNSIPMFLEGMKYLENHNEEVLLRDPVLIGYSLAVSKKGESLKALEIIQDLLFQTAVPGRSHDLYENPDPATLKSDNRILKILRSKHEILKEIYSDSASIEGLKALANTSESIILLIDKIRMSISEEESRLVLGDRYRDLYLMAIYDFEQCYNKIGEELYLEKIFEYTERCKVAGLLAATRELNAIQFHIPSDIAAFEKSVQRDMGYINSQISTENEKVIPDGELLSNLNSELSNKIKTRDSLVMTFEKNFPGYFAIKYNTSSPKLKDIPSITGRNTNYLNYVVSDSALYIFLVNRRYQKFFTQTIDSGFFRKLWQFRYLLSNPSKDDNARTEFNEFQEIGFDLYNSLIEPVKAFLISDNLLISTDNLLSYLPFEVLLTSKYTGKSILYRELDYLMNEFNISYAYSVTLVKELVSRKPEKNRDLVAFAPEYKTNINIDSIFLKRQVQNRYLYDLPYSREEAEYVSSVSKGTPFLNGEARESEYKKVAGQFGIIHLAMHTILNDQNPMNSAMVFTLGNDSIDDGLLYTYEVYGIPLKAMMVVLSSCNTGSGMMSTGEGILSLARGFLYSGSQSVVMSMWEIDDKAGTEVVKMFYNNLKKGKTKSSSLKSARIKYLKNASQLRSHPYFWSSLVIYGENGPVFSSGRKLLITAGGILLLAILGFFYFRHRKYS